MREATIDLRGLAPDLSETCGDYLSMYRGTFAAAVEKGEPGVASARAFARVLDGLLGALYCAADAAGGSHPDCRIALVAVGGYGRGIVGLQSDVDVLFLCDDPNDPHVRMLAEGLLYPLWDLGVDIGHAVRGVEETLRLARDDIRTATTLIDLRRVAGDASIVKDLQKGAQAQVFTPHLTEFLDMLARDTEQRHERFGDSLCLLEPEVKQGRGGLRDLDVAEWAARARWGARSTEDYIRTGALLRREAEELEAAREFLWRVRNYLHKRAGRQQDRLTFADQEDIAVELGFVDGIVLGVEQFMQAYYRHARVVAQTAERMLDRARPTRRRARIPLRDLGDGTALFAGKATLTESERLQDDPALAMRLYRQVLKRGVAPYGYARDAVARAAALPEWRERFRSSEEATQLFIQLLTTTQRAPVRRGSLLTELHEVGLTLAMIPEIEPLTGRAIHDVYHVYTVDVHLIRAVDRLREIFAGEHSTELPLASRLAAETPRRVPLFVATFLHALGKVHGGHRPRRGGQMARPVVERLGLRAVDVDHITWLIENQDSLYHWATRRDTTDPAVLTELASQVGAVERLRDLYLLTVATLSTTNPSALSAWKARMLEDLYLGLATALEGGQPSGAGRAGQIREEVRVGFVGDKEQDALERFIDEMPDRYVLATPVDVIRRHARAVRDAGEAPMTVRLGPGPSEELTELLIITEDRPGLLVDIAAVLAGNQMGVVDAQIYTQTYTQTHTQGKRAFDVFLVRRESRRTLHRADSRPPAIDEMVMQRLTADLKARLEGLVSADDLLARAPEPPAWAQRRSPEVRTEVAVDNEASPLFTVVDVFTRDRVGVLYAIARTLHEQGLTIALSKINTEGDRALDVFYVQDAFGGKIREPARLQALRVTLEDRLRELHESAEAG
ncbi:MAG: [protein-PII] uridylyltransferase [Myxococcota bacterium]